MIIIINYIYFLYCKRWFKIFKYIKFTIWSIFKENVKKKEMGFCICLGV